MRNRWQKISLGLGTLTLLLVWNDRAAADQITGAIFTTTADGTTVNANIYFNKADVYINGGPQNPNGPGLPDGNYYFQVTDPSGQTLLSTDDVTNRELQVVNGNVFGVSGTGTHANGLFNAANNSIPVQLIPYADTPNPGNEYKVWATPVADYDPTQGTFGFLDSFSKTDNFKVEAEVVPEPSTLLLAGLGICGFLPSLWRGRRQQAAV
jgi:hypothetical protein